MNREQTFITEQILAKSLPTAEKAVDENRLQDTLLLLPTDGGLSSRLKKKNGKLRLLSGEHIKNSTHSAYREINKNSKHALKSYINGARKASSTAKRIASEKNLRERPELLGYLKEKHPSVFGSIPRFDQILPMHEELWVNYMREILNIPDDVPSASKLNINGTNALLKLSMADYNGCMITVTKSRNENLRGIKGIVIWDSQKDFILLCRGELVDEIKCVPKMGTIFAFEIPVNKDEALQYTILGDRFKYRSSDRAGRKFKSRRCDDMLYYISGR
ncbi:RNase P/RNase MRP complex subunit [Lachancea thermotolerans CBS 6340]|uniref:Ribonuclease P protein subunit n=1 Tax=Lachancea thermotolerans (strain ATCC 56472 / CBS 6340 / NRRL Y-8284) TaxID=559295 RepID=C5E387_LACTC|nr:KLTH0H11242p [Lachancea thermotolerans CBS 6340]CAR30498.1 KLTH0H11242p [Lachancea thermotolerans CBS 6340]